MHRTGAESGAITTLYDVSGIALKARIAGHPVEQMRLASPFLLRTVQPTLKHRSAMDRLWISGIRRGLDQLFQLFDVLFQLLVPLLKLGNFRLRPCQFLALPFHGFSD
jgi:hypothetical protein